MHPGRKLSAVRADRPGPATGRFLIPLSLVLWWARRWWGRQETSPEDKPPVPARAVLEEERPAPLPFFRNTSKPYVRWWWLAGLFRREDIVAQLHWIKGHGFGGVELAWIWPSWLRPTEREQGVAWLSPEWAELVAFTKRQADALELGCDYTFGSCWPFGGSWVQPEDAAQTFTGLSRQHLHGSWEDPLEQPLRIVNHLHRTALRHYAEALLPAFTPSGSSCAFFCDSLELDTRRMWSAELWEPFAEQCGYQLEQFQDVLDAHPDVRYDYRRFLGDTMVREFFEAYTALCHEHQAFARVQCHGAPVDLLSAYAAVDIPESEALLFEPHFSRIPASAAALAGKLVVSAETFTCIYGFISPGNMEPYRYWKREQVADLKLLADALFAHGINQIVWHGMPYNPPGGTNEFYASVHVGPDAVFAEELPAFNGYLEAVSALMKLGRPYTNLAVYLPTEDHWMLDRIPEERRTPGANYLWEMRFVTVPPETAGYHPLWISWPFLQRAEGKDGKLCLPECSFSGLYVDCAWLDADGLSAIARLARQGVPVILKQQPRQPGRVTRPGYQALVEALLKLPTVTGSLKKSGLVPLVEGDDLPLFCGRQTDRYLYLFFAHPKARAVRYPMQYGQSRSDETLRRAVTIHTGPVARGLTLVFQPYQSVLLRIPPAGEMDTVDITYRPKEPVGRLPDQ